MSPVEAARSLLDRALPLYRDSPAVDRLRALRSRVDGPLRVAVTGAPGSGRTTLLNAVVGEPVAAGSARLTVDWPGDVELVDAGADGGPADAGDVRLHLLPHPGADARVLRAHDPVTTLVVLSRADELAGGRVDALLSARRVAKRQAQGELGLLCQDVLAVSGLLALGAATLTAPEVQALEAFARVAKAELDAALLSADRFTTASPRQAPALLARLGLFGVRWSTAEARRGSTGAALVAEVARASGIVELREAIGTRFAHRAAAFRARSALTALDAVLRRDPRPATLPLVEDLERALTNLHDLSELRALADLDTGRCALGEAEPEARYLLGAHGTTPAARLSASDDAHGALLRWRSHAEDPRLTTRDRRTAAVVARTCERLLTQSPLTAR
ncbi:hypothetical protein [Actinokineospora bangkokensis]|uniref:G domain-containing protein n=1 Tax=Actinokineospora bangkokensis TaxID=1193682 RepID=A0A1Q9LH30_9PSEU|nr:hypothetical protein [Actinokineospora bangkokensis]OLR91326.1 hypothetical protein BJP25_27050 [Actinokineospora bangkokensis]